MWRWFPPRARRDRHSTGAVDVVENLGDELLVYLTVAGRSVLAKLDPRSEVKVGAQVRLHVDNESMHLFDTASGEAIF